jgi:Holliday junction resolvasome RuvABC endonuclease subunit
MQSHLTQSQNQEAPQKKKVTLLSIDPGYRYFGFALFGESADLVHAGLSETKKDQWEAWNGQPPSFLNIAYLLDNYEWVERTAIIEMPKVHRDTPNTDSIVKLAAACGAYTSILQAAGFNVVWVEPRSWKGMTPKNVMFKRIIAKLSEKEYSCINKPKDHNVVDAIGIGLWQIKSKRKQA